MKNINYDKVIIEWLDISSDGCDEAWNSEDEFKNLVPAVCTTIGYLYEDNDHWIKTFATYSFNSDNTLDFGDCVCIPKGVVRSIRKIEN